MKELSLHILDLVQNSIQAQATIINLKIKENTIEDQLIIMIEDDGVGMDKELLEKVSDPFTTTRTTRKVGLGIPLLKAAAEQCSGKFSIISEKGRGTKVSATFQYQHIDRAPLGNMAETVASILLSLDNTDLVYVHERNGQHFVFNTREVKEILGSEVPIYQNEVVLWVKEYIQEGLKNLNGGVDE